MSRARVERWLTGVWYGPHTPPAPLRGLSQVYDFVRRRRERRLRARARHPGVPVVVVGNIAVGGTGKSPLVLHLTESLVERGYHPAILAGGYGGSEQGRPTRVRENADPRRYGDEPVMMANRRVAPVFIGRDRIAAAELAVRESGCNVIVCDDGLQHYALARDVEIALVDARRGHGNGRLLPAGPLREPVERLERVDFVVEHGNPHADWPMHLSAETVRSLDDRRLLSPQRVHGVAGIGHPERFFRTLTALGFEVEKHAFPDHHRYSAADLTFANPLPVVMTEKDAVKWRSAQDSERLWYLPVEAVVADEFIDGVVARLVR